MGQSQAAAEYGERALAIARALGDSSLEILASSRLGLAYLQLGKYREAIAVIKRYLAVLSGSLAHELFEMAALPAVSGRGYLCVCLANLGDFAAAATAAEEAIGIATEAAHPYSLALAGISVGRWRVIRGEFGAALPSLERSLEACQREGFYALPLVAAVLGEAYARSGRLPEAISVLEEGVERGAAMAFMAGHGKILAILGETYLVSGRAEDALRSVRQALDLSRAGKERGFEAEVLRVLGAILIGQGSPDHTGAEISYRQALALATELGMRPLVAHCHLGLGKLYRRTGKQQEAQEHLATATTMYRDMDMRFWLEQAEAELRLAQGSR